MAQPSYPPAPPGLALTCPWCSAAATPSPSVQTCGACRHAFTLTPGPALDASVIAPPPHPNAYNITMKWSIVVTYKFATLDAGGITSGTLDPVVAMAPIDQMGIAFPDVVSIAVWKKLAWTDIIAGTLLPLPMALFCFYVTVAAARKGPGVAVVFGLIGVVFALLTAFLLRRGIIIGRRQARVVGRWASLTVPFASSPTFYGELFRRCGLVAPPVP
jgi:hypothetical protein